VQYADLVNMTEDERIEAIGKTAMRGATVAVCLEENQPAKIERYIKKITERYPELMVIKRTKGPTPLVETITVGRKPIAH